MNVYLHHKRTRRPAGVGRRLMVEGMLVTVLLACVAAFLVYERGYFSWSFDAINHHIYLGYIAEHPRWHLDVTAAGSQSYQYPYLYWPVYRMSLLSGDGATIAALWAGLQAALLATPLWLLCVRLLPSGGSVVRTGAERLGAVLLGFSSVPALAALGTTANDAIAAVPVLWAVALWAVPTPNAGRCVAAAALLGVGIAFKLSNVVYLPLLLAFAWTSPWRAHVWRLVVAGSSMLAGFVVLYSPWGWQLWRHTGNPFHPYLQSVFQP